MLVDAPCPNGEEVALVTDLSQTIEPTVGGALQQGERANWRDPGYFGVYYSTFLVGVFSSTGALMYPVFTVLLGLPSYRVKAIFQVRISYVPSRGCRSHLCCFILAAVVIFMIRLLLLLLLLRHCLRCCCCCLLHLCLWMKCSGVTGVQPVVVVQGLVRQFE
jgi:hypothetical protein